MRPIIILIMTFLIGCNSQSNLKNKSFDSSKIISHSLIVKNKCAVIYKPNDLKIKTYIKKDSNGFYNSSNDAVYYISQTREFLKQNNTKIIEIDLNYIDFYKDNNLLKHFDLSGDNKSWGIILYNGIDEPIESDLSYNEEDFNKVMKK